MNIAIGLLIPFIGTTLGAFFVFFIKNQLPDNIQKSLLGFASGVMIAASVWSLIIPAIDASENMGSFAFFPAAVGIAAGILFLLLMDNIIPHLHLNSNDPEGPKSKLHKTTMLVFAVTLHNIPEGLAVGVIYAGLLSGTVNVTAAGALALSIGIAIQNIPEGLIVSFPIKAQGVSKLKSFGYGVLSGAVEPVAGIIAILLTSMITPLMPYFLSFAAGAMIYVVVEELIPEASSGIHSNHATIGFGIGFIIMMILDVALG